MSYPKKKKNTKWGRAHTVAHSHLKGKARWQVYVRGTGRSRYLSHLVWEKTHGRPLREGYVIHHQNEKPLDNRPSNLEEMTHAEHNSLHKRRKMKSHFRRKGIECKKCKLCGRILPAEMFPLNGHSAAGTPVRRPICIDCYKRLQREDRARRRYRRETP